MKKDIAVTIQNHVQFQSLRIGIDKLIKKGIVVDIFVPKAKDEFGVREMFEDIYDFLQKKGYSPRRKPLKKDSYKILLEPYPMDYYFVFNYDYRIKYKYSAISAKPEQVYNLSSNIYYDAILCHSTFETKFLNAYTKTYNIGSLKYTHFKKLSPNNKKTILYLPTFGDNNCVEKLIPALKKLRSEYRIITKAHHGTNFYNYEKKKNEILKLSFDEYYSQEKDLSELFAEADIVISDNSGAIYEAIYLKIPVVIFTDKISSNLSDIEPLHKTLIKNNVIPYTNNPTKLKSIVDEVQKDESLQKQELERSKLFKYFGTEAVDEFLNVIDMYLYDRVDQDYIKMHRYIVNEYKKTMVEMKNLNNTILTQTNKLTELQNKINKHKEKTYMMSEELNNFYHGKLYKMATKFYKHSDKVKRVVKCKKK